MSDARGLVVRLYANSDAAGSQWQEAHEYDARGRRVRTRGELLEGMGELGPRPDIAPSYHEDPAARTVEVRYPDDYWGEPRVRWTYDARGRPVRREILDDAGETVSELACAYDAAGRVVSRGDQRFEYRGDAPLPHRMIDAGEEYPIRGEPGRIEVRWVGREVPEGADGREPLEEGELDLDGDCVDVLFRPCSPAFAPPPPGRERASLPRP